MKHLETAQILHGTPHECEGSWIINYTWVASRQASSLTMDSEKLKQNKPLQLSPGVRQSRGLQRVGLKD